MLNFLIPSGNLLNFYTGYEVYVTSYFSLYRNVRNEKIFFSDFCCKLNLSEKFQFLQIFSTPYQTYLNSQHFFIMKRWNFLIFKTRSFIVPYVMIYIV